MDAKTSFEPNRVSTAISCQFLNQVSGNLSQFMHLQTICEELYSFVYKDFKSDDPSADAAPKDLRGFMHGMPFFELARSLRVHVTRLEEEVSERERSSASVASRFDIILQFIIITALNYTY